MKSAVAPQLRFKSTSSVIFLLWKIESTSQSIQSTPRVAW